MYDILFFKKKMRGPGKYKELRIGVVFLMSPAWCRLCRVSRGAQDGFFKSEFSGVADVLVHLFFLEFSV